MDDPQGPDTIPALHHLSHLRNGTGGPLLTASLQRYLRYLLKEGKNILDAHSAYFWLYLSRRLRIRDQFLRSAYVPSADNDLLGFSREASDIKRHYDRLTLTILTSARSEASDMVYRQTEGGPYHTGRTRPQKITSADETTIFWAVALLSRYQEALFCLKRALKGGHLRWINRQHGHFDVLLSTRRKRLVDIYDLRAGFRGNLLSWYGSWSPTIVGFLFLLPTGYYTTIHPWISEATLPSFSLDDDAPIVFALIPNVLQRGAELVGVTDETSGVQTAPPWLLQWYNLEPVLPRIALLDSLVRKIHEYHGRPEYDLRDVVLALSAIAQWQRAMWEANPQLFVSVIAFGYSVWTDAPGNIERQVLPRFIRLKQRCRGEVGDQQTELQRLLAIIDRCTWSESKARRVDLLSLTPQQLFVPQNSTTWLVDWSAMAGVLLEHLGAYGWVSGTLAREKGRDLESAFAEYLNATLQTLTEEHGPPPELWWVGNCGHHRLKFSSGNSEDLDFGIIVDDHVLAVELKAYGASRKLLFRGALRALNDRWQERIQPAVAKIDALARKLARHPFGCNYLLPASVRWVVPMVCAPFPEWIPSLNKKWWLYADVPRVCTPEELFDVLGRIRRGEYPLNRYAVRVKRDLEVSRKTQCERTGFRV